MDQTYTYYKAKLGAGCIMDVAIHAAPTYILPIDRLRIPIVLGAGTPPPIHHSRG